MNTTGAIDSPGTMPEVITRYLGAADNGDSEALASCFTPEGTVVDEDVTYRGRAQIIGWREETAKQWTYTSNVVGSEAVEDGPYRVVVHVEGNFPGGVADLTYFFNLEGDQISALSIVG